MPTYLYSCETCNCEFEEFHSINTIIETCPTCNNNVKRLINSMTKGVVELVGQELVDKIKADAKGLAKDSSRNENLYANLLGNDKYESLQRKMDAAKKDRKNY